MLQHRPCPIGYQHECVSSIPSKLLRGRAGVGRVVCAVKLHCIRERASHSRKRVCFLLSMVFTRYPCCTTNVGTNVGPRVYDSFSKILAVILENVVLKVRCGL